MSYRTTLFALQNIIEAAVLDSPLSSVGAPGRAVLFEIGRMVAAGRTPNIGDLVHNRSLGSPVTVLKRLRELEAAGWIVVVRSASEHRAKEVHLTTNALQSFDTVASTVQQSMFKGLSIAAR